ncbi:MAG: MaoC family dehydratase [Clostridia bacterium]|jgi:3-hydroxybutyryl-CoA dehydratase|nr:MaoC family dehydratase [Clostridia bacterium]MCI2000215.1 MaoC family dehydratase [Clostridia bacterium]MCI2014620.1 MaoC family dehydratase [Clostridia bacterium]
MENISKSLNMKGYSIDEIYIGQKESFTKTITEHDVYTFAGLCGDFNPLHVNAEYAKNTRFGERIAHGMLTASLFSTIIGMCIPGMDAIFLGQSCRFLKPVKFNDTVTITGEVTGIRKEKRIVTLKMTIVNQHGEIVVDGEATAMANKGSDKI